MVSTITEQRGRAPLKLVTQHTFVSQSYLTSNSLDASVEIDPAPNISTMTRPCRCDIDFRFMKADELGLFFDLAVVRRESQHCASAW